MGGLQSAYAQLVTWTGDGDGTSWNDPANWSTGVVPGADDDVTITKDGTYTVGLSANISVRSLTLGGASGTQTVAFNNRTIKLGAASYVRANGILRWNGGALNSADTVWVSGELGLEGSDNKSLQAGVVVNQGTTQWTDGAVYIYGGAELINEARFEIATDADLHAYGGSSWTLRNRGELVKTSGEEDGQTQINVIFVNEGGTVTVDAGNLWLNRGGRLTGGRYEVAEQALLQLRSGTFVVQDSLRGEPEGMLALTGSKLAVGDAGGALAFGGTGFQWQDGQVDPGEGRTLVNAGLLAFAGPQSKSLASGRLLNEATLRWSGTGAAYIYGGAELVNEARFEIATDADLHAYGGTSWTLRNRGELVKTSGGAEEATQLNVIVVNEGGTVAIEQGNLHLRRGGTLSGGHYEVLEGALMQLQSGTFVVQDTLHGEPVGTFSLVSTLAVGDAGGALAFGGTGFQWQDGQVDPGEGRTLVNAGLLALAGPQSKSLASGRLLNEATLRWSGTGAAYIYGGAELVNEARFEIATDADLHAYGGTSWTLRNRGELVKTSGGAEEATQLNVIVVNEGGTVAIEQGNLHLRRGGWHGMEGTYLIPENTSLRFQGGTHTFSGSFTTAPEGTLELAGDLAVDAGGATLDVSGTGLRWTSGTISGADSLVNRGTLLLSGSSKTLRAILRNDAQMTASGGSLTIRDGTLHNRGTVRWQSGSISVNESRIINEELFDLQTDISISGGSAEPRAFINRDGGVLQKSAGDGTATFSVDMTNEAGGVLDAQSGTMRFTRALTNAGGLVQGTATLYVVNAAVADSGRVGPGASPGRLRYIGTYAPLADASLEIELGGTAEADYDRLAIDAVRSGFRFLGGDAVLNGTLDVRLIDGFKPSVDDAFTILTAGQGIEGGFAVRKGLVDEAAQIALYPEVRDTSLVLIAVGGVPTLSGTIAVEPGSVVGDRMRTVQVTGTGFGPDVSVTLVCTECPGEQGDIPGLVRTITPTGLDVAFDLRDGSRLGTYDLVVTDPRGGEAHTPFAITPGPPVISIEATDADASEDGRDPGAFTISSNRVVFEPLVIPVQFGGTATAYLDYTTSMLGSAVQIPAGRQSVTVRIFPLSDQEAEDDESVTLRVLASEVYTLEQSLASVSLTDGPSSEDFAIFGITPQEGGNAGLVTATVSGQHFKDGASVRLVSGGQEVIGQALQVNEQATSLTATFNLDGLPLGAYDVMVVNGDGSEQQLPAGFQINAVEEARIWSTIVGPSAYRSGRAVTFQLIYGNRGNVNKDGAIFMVGGIPPEAEVTLGPAFQPPPLLDDLEDYLEDDPLPYIKKDDQLVLVLAVAGIPPGQTQTATFTVRSTESYPLNLFTMSGQAAGPRSEGASKRGRPVPRPGVPASRLDLGQDAAGLALAHGVSMATVAKNNFVSRNVQFAWTMGQQGACVGAAESMYADLSSLTYGADSPLFGWGVQVVTQNGFRIGHTTTMLTSPHTGNHYVIDNYVAPTIVPMVEYGDGFVPDPTWRLVNPDNPFAVLDGMIALTSDQPYWSNASFSHLKKECTLPEEAEEKEVESVQSSDPNDKLGTSGAGDGHYMLGDEPLQYMIRFENKADATAPAAEVIILDTLDLDRLDPSTLSLGAITFGERTVVPPPGLRTYTTTVDLRPERELLLQIYAALDPETGVLMWRFSSLDPETKSLTDDPFAGFLPPNQTSPEGEGSVSFSIALKPDQATGTRIENDALIYFDLNDPIATPPWVNTVDHTAPHSSIGTLDEVQTDSTFTVTWGGEDEGAGVRTYSVYVSENGGPFVPWIVHTNETSAPFAGLPDASYAFFSIARDGTGNVEPMKTEAEAATTVAVAVEDASDLPTRYELAQNYPNPFNPSTTIAFALPQEGPVRLTVFDALGRRVAVLVDERRPAGRYQVEWDATRLASGMYFYRLEVNDFVETRKLVLLK